MNEAIRNTCVLLNKKLNELNKLLTNLKEQIIIKDLSFELDRTVLAGRKLVAGLKWIDETDVNGETFTLIDKSKQKYYGYVVLLEKEYHIVGLGFMYKNEIISPHMEFCIDDIIRKYSDAELEEISDIVKDTIKKIDADIDYLINNKDTSMHKYYYGEYNKGFDSHHRYNTISDVITDFKGE